MYATAPASGRVLHTMPTTWWAALSLGAAAIHFAVIPDHLEEWWAFGLCFAGLGWFQAVWPIIYRDRPTRPLASLAVAVNFATVIVWAWSRTAGLPVGPEPGMPEAVGAADLVSTLLEVALVAGLLGTQVVATSQSRAPARDAAIGRRDLAIWALVAGLSTAAIALGTA
ncbi:MAG TPA: hypothetical protein VGK16_06140 [Candidatus Limnocylindrales bacterium]|jgi:hypothetical protein